jgi:hypothetical protein
MVPLLIFTIGLAVLHVQTLIDEQVNDLERAAVNISEVIDNRMMSARMIVERMAEITRGPQDLGRLKEHASIAIMPKGGALVVHNLRGEKIFDATHPDIKETSAAGQGIIAGALERNQTTFSQVYKATSTGGWRISVITPLIRDGAPWGVLGIGISPDTLAEVIGWRGMPRGMRWGITQADGTVIMRSRDADKFVGTKIAQRLVGERTESSGLSWDNSGVSGEAVVRAWARVPATGWSVAAVLPQAVVLAPAYSALYMMISALAATFAVLAIVLWTLLNELIGEPDLPPMPDGPFGKGKPAVEVKAV